MCGGFTCSKNALISLNILYILVSFILIGVAVYGRAASLVTNLPIVGGILGCGVILLVISVLGLVGAVKHHQVMLFFVSFKVAVFMCCYLMGRLIVKVCRTLQYTHNYFLMLNQYMVILFLLFLIQFSIACACLAVNMEQQEQWAEQGWSKVDNNTKMDVQKAFACCGYQDCNLIQISLQQKCCPNPEIKTCECPTCMSKLQSTINYAFKLCGGIGLFFSFTEFLGVWLTVRYRNQKDPRANPSAFL